MIISRRYPVYRNANNSFSFSNVSLIDIPGTLAASIADLFVRVWCSMQDGLTANLSGNVTTSSSYRGAIATDGAIAASAGTGPIATPETVVSAFGGIDPLQRAALATAAKLQFRTSASGTVNIVVAGMDLWISQDEPEVSNTIGATTSAFVLRWPPLNIIALNAAPAEITPSFAVLLATPPVNKDPLGEALADAGQGIPFTAISTASAVRGFCQLQVNDLSTCTVDGDPFGRANPTDTWQLTVYALVSIKDTLPDNLTDPFLPIYANTDRSSTYRWIPTGAFVTIPGGWDQVGYNWSATNADTLDPGGARLGQSELNATQLASAVVPIPKGAMAIAVKSWCYNTYTGGTPPVVASLRLAVW